MNRLSDPITRSLAVMFLMLLNLIWNVNHVCKYDYFKQVKAQQISRFFSVFPGFETLKIFEVIPLIKELANSLPACHKKVLKLPTKLFFFYKTELFSTSITQNMDSLQGTQETHFPLIKPSYCQVSMKIFCSYCRITMPVCNTS